MTKPDDNPSPNLRETRREIAAAKKAGGTVTPLTAAKKAAAKNAVTERAGTPAKKAPGKKAPAKTAATKTAPTAATIRDKDHPWYVRTGYKAVPGQKLFEATGRSGQIAVRSCSGEMKFAVDWAQPGHQTDAVKIGTIYNFYEKREQAERMAAKLLEGRPGDSTVVVEARPYRGQPGDKDAKVAQRPAKKADAKK